MAITVVKGTAAIRPREPTREPSCSRGRNVSGLRPGSFRPADRGSDPKSGPADRMLMSLLLPEGCFPAMPDPATVALVFEELKSRLCRQEATLDEIRARAGAVVGIASVAVSFLAGRLGGDRGLAFWLGVLLILVAVVTALYVLFPREKSWFFSPKPTVLLQHWVDLPPTWYHKYLSEEMVTWIEKNQVALQGLYKSLKWAIRVAGLGIVILLAELARGVP